METIAEKTKKIIAETLGVEQNALSLDTDLVKRLGVDSLDVVELVVNLEKEFKVAIPDEQVERLHTVGHFIDYFEQVKSITIMDNRTLLAA